MSNSLGVLTLDLVAKIRDFVEPLRQAERQTSTTSKSILKDFDVASLAVKTFGAIVAGVTINDLAGFVSRTIDAGNEIKKLALLSNASTSQFQYYAYGAKTAGFEIEDFADKMKDMQDRIGDFQQTGGGPLADFFTNIAPLVGVTIQQFQKLSGPEALQLFYDSLEKFGATKNDIKFYMESIIGDSSKLLPLLENGGAGFKKFGDAAKAAGAILSEDVVNDLAQTKESLQLLDLKWEGLKNRLASDITPIIKDAVDNFDTIQAVVVALAAALGAKLIFQVGALSVQFAFGVAEGIRYQMTLAAMAGQSVRTAAAMGILKGAIGFLGGPAGIAMLAVQGVAAYSAFKYMKSGSQDLSSNLDAQSLSVQELIKKYNELTSAQKEAFSFEESKKLVEATKDYKNAKANFYDSAVGIAYEGANSGTNVAKIDSLVKSFKNGEITALAFADAMSEMGVYSKEQISTTVKFAEVNDNAKLKLENQKKVVETLTGKANKLTETHKATTLAISDQTRAYQALTEKQRSYITQLNQDSLRENYIKDLVGRGFSQEKANTFADTQASVNEGYAFKKALPKEVVEATLNDFNRKNYELSANDRKKIAGAVAFVTTNSLENISKSKGIPGNLLTGLIAQESGGKNLTSPTGATGEFQTTAIFRKQHAATLKAGNYSHASFAQAASDELLAAYKEFGNWADALMAYNGGVAGTKAFKAGRVSDQVKAKSGSQLINGQLFLSPAKAREMQNYPNQVLKYQAGANGSSKIDQSMSMPTSEDLLKWQNEAIQTGQAVQDAKDAFEKQLSTPLKQMELENNETVEKLQETFADDPKKLKEMLDKNNVLYQANRNKLIAEKKNEYNQYFSFEKDRITQVTESYDYEISKIKENTDYTISERNKMAAAKEREKQAEIASIKLEQKEQILSANEAYMSETEALLRRFEIEREQITLNKSLTNDAKTQLLEANSMAVYQAMERNRTAISDVQQEALVSRFQRNNSGNYGQFDGSYQQWDMQNAYSFASGGIDQAYNDQVSGINLIKDEEQRKQQLLEAEQRFLEAKKALNDQYNEQERDARNSMQADNIATYGAMFGGMADLVKGFAGESSGAYRTMIAAQKAANLASAIMSGYTSIAAAWGSKPFPYNLPAVAIATAKAGVFQAAIQAVSPGFSEGGYTGDGGKYEAAGIVHKGEGVLTQEEVSALGGPVGFEYLRKAIRTGDLFENSEISASQSFMALAGYAEGGFVGGDVSLGGLSLPKQINKPMNTSMAQYSGGDINITVQVSDSGVTTSGGNTQDQKQLALLIGNTVKAVLRKEKGQGGLLSK
ncbi:replication protein [Acinetobacter sp.]|uniref:replication protein n=1 Tax=Acinetobacter sp. TaxID=472 RepID=UPI0039824FF9